MKPSDFPYRKALFCHKDIQSEQRDDGSIIVRSNIPLQAFPQRLSDRLIQWAENTPESIFISETMIPI